MDHAPADTIVHRVLLSKFLAHLATFAMEHSFKLQQYCAKKDTTVSRVQTHQTVLKKFAHKGISASRAQLSPSHVLLAGIAILSN